MCLDYSSACGQQLIGMTYIRGLNPKYQYLQRQIMFYQSPYKVILTVDSQSNVSYLNTEWSSSQHLWYRIVVTYRFLFKHSNLLLTTKLRCQGSFLVHVLAYLWTTETCCLLRAVVSNGIFYTCFHFLYIAHITPTFLWVWQIYHAQKVNCLGQTGWWA